MANTLFYAHNEEKMEKKGLRIQKIIKIITVLMLVLLCASITGTYSLLTDDQELLRWVNVVMVVLWFTPLYILKMIMKQNINTDDQFQLIMIIFAITAIGIIAPHSTKNQWVGFISLGLSSSISTAILWYHIIMSDQKQTTTQETQEVLE